MARPRHTMDTAAMIEMLMAQEPAAGGGGDEGHTCTVDLEKFQKVFGAQEPGSSERKKRRETADPSKLRELLEQCVIDDADEEGADREATEENADERVPARNSQFRRRMTCDPRLLKQLVLDGEAPRGLSRLSEGSSEPYALQEDLDTTTDSDGGPAGALVDAACDEPLPAEAPAASSVDEAAAPLAGPAAEDHGEEDDEFDDEIDNDVAYNRRGSVAWTFDEQRATLQELRRQLRIEKELATDAEYERDELAKEARALRSEMSARADLLAALETQRDAANARAAVAEQRAVRADADAARAQLLKRASDAAADAGAADARHEVALMRSATADGGHRTAHAEALLRAAERRTDSADEANADLRQQVAALEARVKALDKVKITKSFAQKVHQTVEERDHLAAELAQMRAKENNGVSPLPFTTSDRTFTAKDANECRQS